MYNSDFNINYYLKPCINTTDKAAFRHQLASNYIPSAHCYAAKVNYFYPHHGLSLAIIQLRERAIPMSVTDRGKNEAAAQSADDYDRFQGAEGKSYNGECDHQGINNHHWPCAPR